MKNLNNKLNEIIERSLHGKNDFAERSKISLATDLKIILLVNLKIMSKTAKNFDILAISST